MPLPPALAGMGEILVFRALMLGDWLCATPALRALRRAAPRARIVACGLPWTAELMRRLPMVDDFLAFPGHPLLPEGACDAPAFERFVAQARERRFDLALQMHGSGGIVNPFVAALGAAMTAGFATPDTARDLDLAVPWPETGSEVERCLALTAALGAPSEDRQIAFPLTAADRQGAAALRAAAGAGGRFAIVHAGSQLPSRRWAPARFAAVADALAGQGLRVLLTGTAGEASITAAVAGAARRPVADLAGRTDSLWTLGALVESAALVVANDTGISHIAAALGTPSVIVASGSDVARWAPHDRRRHRVLWHATACRPCAHAVCPTAHECAAGVAADAVIEAALAALGTSSVDTTLPTHPYRHQEAPCPTTLADCAS